MEVRPLDRPRLSAAMIVRDEAAFLPGSLESLRPVADELVVLDTGSTDGTPEKARQGGARVIQAPWVDDFAAARNRLLGAVRGRWVLWLDAGERLAADSLRPLGDFLDRQADPGCVYRMRVELPPSEAGGCGQAIYQPRLVPCRKDLRFRGRVRETLGPAIQAAGLAVQTAPGRILRHPRDHRPDRKAARAERDLRLVGLAEAELGSLPPRLAVARGEALSDLGHAAVARQAFLDAMNRASPGSPELLDAYYGLLALPPGPNGNLHWELLVCQDGLIAFPEDAQLLCALGHRLDGCGQPDRAVRAFQQAAFSGRIHPETWHLTEIRQIAAVAASVILELGERLREARRTLEQALGRSPGARRIVRRLMDVYVKEGLEENAVTLVDLLPLALEFREAARNAVRGAAAATRGQWAAALGLLQTAYRNGYREPFCLRWLTISLLENGQPAPARTVLAQWLRREPDDPEARRYQEVLDAARPASEPGRRYRIDSATPGHGLVPTQPPLLRPAEQPPH